MQNCIDTLICHDILKRNWKCLQTAKAKQFAITQRVGRDREVRQAAHQRRESDFAFQPRQRCPKTVMNPIAETKMPRGVVASRPKICLIAAANAQFPANDNNRG